MLEWTSVIVGVVAGFAGYIVGHLDGWRRHAEEMSYEIELLKIRLHDSKDWSEEAILSIFADRTPFLTSYLNLTNPPANSNPKRLLIPPLIPPTPNEVF